MSGADNENLLRTYLREVWEEGEPEAVERFAAETYLRHRSPTSAPLDRAGQIERLKGFRRAFSDISIDLEHVVVSDDTIAFRGTIRGTHQAEFLGIPATGRQVVVGLLDFIRVEDGLFIEHWGGPDMYDLLEQLGASPSA